MNVLGEREIRGSVVNATRGEIRRMGLPPDFDTQPWEDLGHLSWLDPRSPLVGYLVVPTPEHGLVGVQVRRSSGVGGTRRARMCALCATTHVGQESRSWSRHGPGRRDGRGTPSERRCARHWSARDTPAAS
ncbi:hypothetical protein EPD83_009340 [Phycicoccus sp. CMS6Z-2]|nr:hypothetical protein [Phycicoccus flavus]